MIDIGQALIEIAEETGVSFEMVTAAATELAQQGLSTEQIISRTRDVIILSQYVEGKHATD